MKLDDFPIVHYRSSGLNTGDIILCSGNGELSGAIKSFQGLAGLKSPAKDISHIACIVRLDYEQLIYLRAKTGEAIFSADADDLYVFESTTFNKWAGKKGVQINPLWLFAENYDGKIFVRQLQAEIDIDKVIQFVIEHIDDNYENGISGFFELLFCGLMWSRFIKKIFPKWKPAASKNPHCSENVARLLKYLGLLKDIAFENRMPPAVWSNNLDVHKLHLEAATLDENILCKISEPIRIK